MIPLVGSHQKAGETRLLIKFRELVEPLFLLVA